MSLSQIEMQALRAQIMQAQAYVDSQPKIAAALERIADALEYQQGDVYQDGLRTTEETK